MTKLSSPFLRFCCECIWQWILKIQKARLRAELLIQVKGSFTNKFAIAKEEENFFSSEATINFSRRI